jgi:hypothetical protein
MQNTWGTGTASGRLASQQNKNYFRVKDTNGSEKYVFLKRLFNFVRSRTWGRSKLACDIFNAD